MKMREKPLLKPDEEKVFFKIVRAAFEQRRKTLLNALYSVFNNNLDKVEVSNIIKKCGHSTQIRGETLSLDNFLSLAAEFGKNTE
jgi:16S rRNA (adenine1518-N6/adenine1519-N6)-dimethyltransferase